MKLFKALISSDGVKVLGLNMQLIYVVAENYSVAERILHSDEDNTYWHDTTNRRIIQLEELEQPVIGETP